MRLVLDTDVVLSGLRSAVGASRVILLAVEAGVIVPLASIATVMEYEAVLKRAENLHAAGIEAEDVDRFLDEFLACADHVQPYYRTRPLLRDPDDEMFAELAVNGQADALVSFNVRDYMVAETSGRRFDVTVCRPGEVLRRLPWRPSAASRSAFRLP